LISIRQTAACDGSQFNVAFLGTVK